jgi:ABC-2 type transport system ATP-binding protein
MSACQNLKMAARFYEGLSKNRIDEVLEIVGLSAYKNEKVSQFSLGMKQRLGIASAILSQPDLLILDEPTNGLDIEGMADIRNLILELAHEQQVTFFVSSHLAHEMELICNRVGILNNGKLIREGVVAQLLQSHDSLEDFFIQQAKEDRRNNVNE